MALMCGGIFFVGLFSWILEITQYRWLHHAILDVYFGLYVAVFGLSLCYVNVRRGTIAALLSAPFLWVCQEYLRANMGFLALPWGLLAHTQYENVSLLQIASVAGAYGVSFMIVLANAVLTALIFYPACRRLGFGVPEVMRENKMQARGLVLAGSLLILLAVVYGKVTAAKPFEGPRLKVGVIQGNIAQARKWDPEYAATIMQVYESLTRQAAKEHPDLIVWPETATPKAINLDRKIAQEVKNLAKEAGSSLLIGSAQVHKFKLDDPKKAKYYNSAFLISPAGTSEPMLRYDKIQLVPFGEYLPLRTTLPWSYLGVPDKQAFLAGKEFTVFKLPSCRFSTTICWESIFPDVVRSFVNQGAQFIVNISNEAWFGKTAAPYQFLSMNVLRAVENRVFVIRCANTGVSCFIDPHGRIVDRVTEQEGQDIFVAGQICQTVVPSDAKTLYTKYGDFFAWGCNLASLGFLVFAAIRRRQAKHVKN